MKIPFPSFTSLNCSCSSSLYYIIIRRKENGGGAAAAFWMLWNQTLFDPLICVLILILFVSWGFRSMNWLEDTLA